MLNEHITKEIIKHLGFNPTEGQNVAAERLADFIFSEAENKTFLLKGYAGTGKTSLVSAFIKYLMSVDHKIILMAPTGRAAKVLTGYSGIQATTIHKRIYRQRSSTDDFGRFDLDRNLFADTIFIVDEASMINNSSENSSFGTGDLLKDLLYYVFSGTRCSLVLIGDEAQLPPIGTFVSAALDLEELVARGCSVVFTTLKDVVRQSLESGILKNATNLRNRIEEWQEGEYPELIANYFADFESIQGGESIEKLDNSYRKVGQGDAIVVTRSNKRANKFNAGIRGSIMYIEEQIAKGDRIMVVKNNYFWSDKLPEMEFIANGDIAEIIHISGYETLYDLNFANVTLRFPDYQDVELDAKIILSTLYSDGPALTLQENRDFYYKVADDYTELTNKKDKLKKIRENEYYNALQVKFSYAVTCHKAQGGQWKHVYIDQGYVSQEMLTIEYFRWLYTAITRATEKIYLVNFPDDFFAKS